MSSFVTSTARYVVEFEGIGFYAADQKRSYTWVFTRDVDRALEYRTFEGADQRGKNGVAIAATNHSFNDDPLTKAGKSLRYRVHTVTKVITTTAAEWVSHDEILKKERAEKIEKYGPPETIRLSDLIGAR